MRRRVAKKVARQIRAGAPCPRVDGRGYRVSTCTRATVRLRRAAASLRRATAQLWPPSLMSEAFRLHVAWCYGVRRPFGLTVLDCTP